MLQKLFFPSLACALSLMLCGCLGSPKGIEPVTDFEIEKYMGKWYEIARLDHSFERGLSHVSADYSLKDDYVLVVNRGYSQEKGQWKEAIGKAKPYKETDKGHLKVSFFGPFYSSYLIFELGDEYEYAFVCGPNRSYLWYLSRSNAPNEEVETVFARFLKLAQEKGFNTEEIIRVDHREDAL